MAKFGKHISFAKGRVCKEFDRDCSELAYTFPVRPKHWGPYSPRGGGSPSGVVVILVQRQATVRNDINRFTRLVKIQSWSLGAIFLLKCIGAKS